MLNILYIPPKCMHLILHKATYIIPRFDDVISSDGS